MASLEYVFHFKVVAGIGVFMMVAAFTLIDYRDAWNGLMLAGLLFYSIGMFGWAMCSDESWSDF